MIGPQNKPTAAVASQQQELLDKAKGDKKSTGAEVEKVEEKDPEDLEVEARVAPDELEGLESMWRVATESAAKNVIDSAARLLVSLHHNVVAELRPRIPEFDQQFAETCFALIETQKATLDARTQEEKDQVQAALLALGKHATAITILRALPAPDRIIVRSLFLLKQMIRASEKAGTHGVRPHAALGKGTYLDKLSASNNITAS
jgi:hypothetical protein